MIDPQHPRARSTAWTILIIVALLWIDATRMAPLLAFIGVLVLVVFIINLGIGLFRWSRRQR